MSHETIRQKVLKIESEKIQEQKESKQPNLLFLEDVHKQSSNRSTCEAKIGIIHERWERQHPSSKEYKLEKINLTGPHLRIMKFFGTHLVCIYISIIL